jgi:coenzyme F420-dependent glucose-6-phosphate dehydrogenase
VYVSAFGPRAAAVAAQRSDGVWTLADPEQAPEIIDAYRGACDDAGKEPGEIILQGGFSWAADDDAALEGSRVWKSTQVPDYFTDDWHDPRAMYERAEKEVSDDEFKEAYIVSSDPEVHAERVREIERLGATTVCLQNGSGSAPEQAVRVYGEQVLPALRGARV